MSSDNTSNHNSNVASIPNKKQRSDSFDLIKRNFEERQEKWNNELKLYSKVPFNSDFHKIHYTYKPDTENGNKDVLTENESK